MEVETHSSQTQTQETTQKRKSPENLYVEKLIVEAPADILDLIQSIDLYKKDEDGTCSLITDLKWEKRMVRMKKTENEKRQHNRIYRKEYNSRPVVVAKNRANAQKPENLEKRALYAKKDSTKERKKTVNKRNRIILKKVKQLKPDIYREFLEEVIDGEETVWNGDDGAQTPRCTKEKCYCGWEPCAFAEEHVTDGKSTE